MMRILIRAPATVFTLIAKEEQGAAFVCVWLCLKPSRNYLWPALPLPGGVTSTLHGKWTRLCVAEAGWDKSGLLYLAAQKVCVILAWALSCPT